ncbi:MAG: RtcB family protein [Chitinivibrionales bacterium]|nr:RtcB family protein [Chitinivibrionales bacterium]MBD3394620.1 RtcB family protein [Chitinivibrionales bacterium]
MKWIDTKHRVPISSWCETVEDDALGQAVNLTKLPFVYHHVALMADCHSGYGMPIGGVIACLDTVVPNAVGVDIGCGMCAVRTTLGSRAFGAREVRRALNRFRKRIPAGFDHHARPQSWDGFHRAPDLAVVRRELDSARRQLGTLGGGNHFIELQKDDAGRVWLMVHSGSRNFGYRIAREYHRAALSCCEKHRISLPDRDLAYLPLDQQIARDYLAAMTFALDFAYENRRLMKAQCMDVLAGIAACDFDNEVNIHHNFASREKHFGREVVVHRKGATCAREGQKGIIPGSMGARSYIVRGLGNPDSFMSCSHGAGRVMGRNEANRRLSRAEVRDMLGGVVLQSWPRDRHGKVDLSEAPQAYKDIDAVIAAQRDLVEVLYRLEPLGVMKG